MASSMTLTVGELLTVLSGVVMFLATVAGIAVGWIWRSHREFHGRINRLRDEFYGYKTQVAETYVPTANLIRIEEKLIAAITNLSDKLDRIISSR